MRSIWMLAFCLVQITGFGQLSEDFISNYNPSRDGLVIDQGDVLSNSEEQLLERKLLDYADSTSTQIFIVIVSTVNDDINLYASELGDDLGVGMENEDNGCLILVAVEDRKMSIQNGRGLEEFMTDYTTKEIIDNVIAPNFKIEDYYTGLDQGTTAIFQVLNGTFDGDGSASRGGGNERRFGFFALLFIIVIIIIVSNRRGGGGRGPGGRGGRMHGGYWIGGFGGGSSGGSFGGGGFGGFGGGSFGGGGASGGW